MWRRFAAHSAFNTRRRQRAARTTAMPSLMLSGCAFFHNLLKPASMLRKALQTDDICIVTAIGAKLWATKAIDTIKTTDFDDLPTVKQVAKQLQEDDNGNMTYQDVKISQAQQGADQLCRRHEEFAGSAVSCIQHRIKVQHPQLLTVLATQGWQKGESSDDALPFIE